MPIKPLYLSLLLVFCAMPIISQSVKQLKEKAIAFEQTNRDSAIYYWNLFLASSDEEISQSNQFIAHEALSFLYERSNNYEAAKIHAYKRYSFSSSEKDSCISLASIANLYQSANPIKADSLFEKSMECIDKTPNFHHSSVYYNYGKLKESQGQLDQSIELYVNALQSSENDFQKMQFAMNISSLFRKLKIYDRSEEYIKLAIELAEKNNYKFRNKSLANAYAALLIDQGKIDQAKKELELVNKNNKANSREVTHAMLRMAYINNINRNFNQADLEVNQVLKNKSLLTPNEFCGALGLKAKIQQNEKDYQGLLKSGRNILDIANASGLFHYKKKAHLYISIAEEGLGNPTEALANARSFKALEDSLSQAEQIIKLNLIESEYKRKDQNQAIDLLASENQVKALQLGRKNNLLLFGGIALISILGLLAFLYKLLQKIKDQNRLISKSLEEKDTLLREIHHRVKNNLQLVSSLLGLQSKYVQDPNALEALNSGKSRVKSMALIHQDLYHRENLTGVNVKTYLEKLIADLVRTYQASDRIEVNTKIQDLDLDVDTLIPLGLIINEVITNSIKYAFPDERMGEIDLEIFEDTGGLHLKISDNGIGFNLDKQNSNSFGYKLIFTLLDQLEGRVESKIDHGTHLDFIFQEYKMAI